MAHNGTSSQLLSSDLVKQACVGAVLKLNPRVLAGNPVMFLVEIGSVLTTLLFFVDLASDNPASASLSGQLSLWLWFTVLFANFAESFAEGRGKAQAQSLRKARRDVKAMRRNATGGYESVDASMLRKTDVVMVQAGELIPADGTVIAGVASVDESAITGESAPVIRESGGDRSAVTGGTRVLSDHIVVEISVNPGEAFLDRMIAMVEGAVRQKTPNEVALNALLIGLTLIFLMVVITLRPFSVYANAPVGVVILVALLVCLIPTTIGALLSSIGIAGMDRLVKRNVLALSGRAVEAAGDVDILILDKTGTITVGNRMATEYMPDEGVSTKELAEAALWSSFADTTPEGRSIVALSKQIGVMEPNLTDAEFIAFSADTRMSGVNHQSDFIRKGAVDAMTLHAQSNGHTLSATVKNAVVKISKSGGTPLVVSKNGRPLGVIYLKDVLKVGIKDRLQRLRAMGIQSIMITGDNPLTAEAVAKEAGVDHFFAEATPETKLRLIRDYQKKGHMVAMSGDGTNDAPALAQSDVGLVMNTGTQAAREAGNMVDLDSDPTKLIEVVEIGKQLLITRGALTTFSIANDVAKYFAIIPALFAAALPQLGKLNVMALQSPGSAILSAVIFNALVIIFLIPLALRGVSYRPQSAAQILRKNLAVYGVGGIVAPFVGIKLIDVLINVLGIA